MEMAVADGGDASAREAEAKRAVAGARARTREGKSEGNILGRRVQGRGEAAREVRGCRRRSGADGGAASRQQGVGASLRARVLQRREGHIMHPPTQNARRSGSSPSARNPLPPAVQPHTNVPRPLDQRPLRLECHPLKSERLTDRHALPSLGVEEGGEEGAGRRVVRCESRVGVVLLQASRG